MKDPVLYIIIPCYNEAQVLPVTAPMFLNQLQTMISEGLVSSSSKILFVNDGSKDETWSIIESLSKENEAYHGISLSRNRGHQNALLGGLMEAKDLCDITISIDCDGQDDISVMTEMVKQYRDGSEIVYGVRSKRDTDAFMKRFTAESYYKMLKGMGVEVVYNHADYRLVSSRVLKEFSHFEEVNLFLRGMFPLVGFKSTSVYYERHERLAGKTHYPFSKSMHLAFDGITSLSTRPIHIITCFGLLVSVLCFLFIIYIIIGYFMGTTVPGWASTVTAIGFFSGVQLICLGVIGEYIGKIYLETKHRPRYIISERTFDKDKKDSDSES